MQKDRAARNVEQSRQVDYIKDEVAKRLCERLLVRFLGLFLGLIYQCDTDFVCSWLGYKAILPEHTRPRRK